MRILAYLKKIFITPTPRNTVPPQITNQKVQSNTEQDVKMLIEAALNGEGSFYTGERGYAARELGKLGEAAKDTVPKLIEKLTDRNPTIRENATDALGELGPVAIDAVPVLAKLLGDIYEKDQNINVRISAAFALERIGLATKYEIDLISRATRYDNAVVSYHAKRALEKIKEIEPPPLTPKQKKELKDFAQLILNRPYIPYLDDRYDNCITERNWRTEKKPPNETIKKIFEAISDLKK